MATRDELSEALDRIKAAARSMRVEFDGHALLRMRQRNVSLWEASEAVRCAHSIRESAADNVSDWTVTGPDQDGDDLDLGVRLKLAGNVYVVTLY